MSEKSQTTRFDELKRVVEGGHHGRWLVLTHDNPDPDALAAATILAHVLRRGLGQRVTTAYGGMVGRAENRELVRTLRLNFSRINNLAPRHYARYALVDTQPGTGNNQLFDGVAPDVVIDHHPARRGSRGVPLADIRPDRGATAAIVAEYVRGSGVTLSRCEATALVYAIRSETQDFSREYASEDKAVYDEYLPRVDKRALGKIQNARLPVSYFRSLHQALANLCAVDRLVVSHIEEVDQPDIVPELAELLVRMEGKTWSLCTGLHDGRVYLSIRTTNPRADAGGVMRALVGRNGKGGGHAMTAGGWVDLTAGYADRPRTLQELLARKLAKHLERDPDKLEPVAV